MLLAVPAIHEMVIASRNDFEDTKRAFQNRSLCRVIRNGPSFTEAILIMIGIGLALRSLGAVLVLLPTH
jgi:hypothetical protein